MLTLEDYEKLESAWEYQDFVTKKLFELGISVNAYQSRKYQMDYGESASGIEIKNDRNMAKTGNLYIEFKQTTIRGTENVDSGINQKDDSWLYAIGDYDVFYLFSKQQLKGTLKKVQSNPKMWWDKYGVSIRTHKNEEGKITSYGLVIPTKYAETSSLALLKIGERNEKV